MADLKLLINEFKDFMDTLKETSRGGKNGNQFLCESTELVYNFEKYVDFKEKIEKNSNFQRKRFDALYIDNDIVYCIEFKIEKFSDIDKREIEEKLLDSFEILKIVFNNLKIQIKNYIFIFFVIYKDINQYFDKRKNNDIGFALESRLNSLSKQKLPNLKIHNQVNCKSNFLPIYNQIFSTKC